MQRIIIISITLLDLVWTALAVFYDWGIFVSIPLYLWPFLIICPIYPLLLSIVWVQSFKKTPNVYLLAFAAIPSAVYLLAAIIYYLTWMFLNGFDWLTFGAIFWVTAYGLQGIYLLLKYNIDFLPSLFVGIFLISSFIIQYSTKTAGAQDFSNFSDLFLLVGYSILSLASILVVLVSRKSCSETDLS